MTAVAICNNEIVEGVMRALKFICLVWPWTGVQRSRTNIGEARRNMIGTSENKNDRLLIYLKAQDCKMTQTMEVAGLKSKIKKNKIVNDVNYVGML